MIYLEAPTRIDHTLPRPLVFLAGGITNCPDWQQDTATALSLEPGGQCNFTLLNPRRKNFPMGDPGASQAQIAWEHEALWSSDIILFWFSRGSDNPIVLLEYGMHLMRNRLQTSGAPTPIVGCDPEYPRAMDVRVQTQLLVQRCGERVEIHDTLDATWQASAAAILRFAMGVRP